MAAQVLIILFEEGSPPNLRAWVEAAEGAAELTRIHVDSRVEVVKSLRQREEMVERVVKDPPDIIFLPVQQGQEHAAGAFLMKLRPHNPPTALAVGGPMGTLASDVFTFNPATHAVVLGDWQKPLGMFAFKYVREGSGADVPGVWWRGVRGWQITPPTPGSRDLEELAPAEWGKTPIEEMLRINGRAMPILASRGCPYSCTFCHVPQMRTLNRPAPNYRCRSVRSVIEHAAEVCANLQPKSFVFVDDLFPWNSEWVEEFAEEWKERIHLPFRWTSAVEQLTSRMLGRLAGAGGECVELGVETGDEAFRAQISNRNLSNEQLVNAVHLAHDAGVRVAVNLMSGIPRMGREEAAATIELMRDLDADEVSVRHHAAWPEKANWSETDHEGLEVSGFSIRGGSSSDAHARPNITEMRETAWLLEQLRRIDTFGRLRLHQPRAHSVFDGLAWLPVAQVRSPLTMPVKIDWFHTDRSSKMVAALKVPTEVSWNLDLPADPILDFGILLEPQLPGLRSRDPIAFSVKFEQGGRTFRVFQKVLIQSLDPDSRRWHHFSIPLVPSRPGPARLIIDNLIFGRDASALPREGDIWAGWFGLNVSPRQGDGSDSAHSMEMSR